MNKKYVCTFDYGNTKEKGALYLNDEFKTHFVIKDFSDIVQKYNLNVKNCQIIECSVKSTQRVKTNIPSHNVKEFFKNSKFFEMPVHYSETLGMDRLVQAYYLYHLDSSSQAIIDAGTFTTIDFTSSDGFLGGYILPGFEVLRKTYQAGDLLKSHDIMEKNKTETIPQTSPDAIGRGFYLSFTTPIKEILKKHEIKKVFLTGGNSSYVLEELKNDKDLSQLELITKENLIHESLKFISSRMILS
jgi:pantothenate kinase type III